MGVTRKFRIWTESDTDEIIMVGYFSPCCDKFLVFNPIPGYLLFFEERVMKINMMRLNWIFNVSCKIRN